jgi:hypothetical protein
LPCTTSWSPAIPAARERELAERRGVGSDAFLGEEPQHGDVRERLRTVEELGVGHGCAQAAGLSADRLLAVDDERCAEAVGQVCGSDATERERSSLDARRIGEELEHRRILPGTVFGS